MQSSRVQTGKTGVNLPLELSILCIGNLHTKIFGNLLDL